MKEYIDIDKNVIVYDTRGRRCEVTVRHILEKNHGEYEIDDVVPVVRGKWKLVGSVFPMYECDQCRAISLGGNFCPNCGADMREES